MNPNNIPYMISKGTPKCLIELHEDVCKMTEEKRILTLITTGRDFHCVTIVSCPHFLNSIKKFKNFELLLQSTPLHK